MDKEAVLTILSRFREMLEAEGIRVDRMILYGSYASGKWHALSDIDVVVISQDFESMTFWERIRVVSGAVAKLWKPIEPVAMTPEEWDSGRSLIVDFASSGEVVYGETHPH